MKRLVMGCCRLVHPFLDDPDSIVYPGGHIHSTGDVLQAIKIMRGEITIPKIYEPHVFHGGSEDHTMDLRYQDSGSHQDFWNECHLKNNQHFLTGSSGSQVWKNLQIEDRICAGSRVLNIGVGLGYCTKDLVSRGCKVDVLDISPIALSRVSSIVENSWLPNQFDLMPVGEYDLVLSHLVSQHMPTSELEKQVQYIVKALAPSGLFAMQFSSWLPGVHAEVSTKNIKSGGMCYSQVEMQGIIERCGGRVQKMAKIYEFPAKGSSWSIVHITKLDYDRLFRSLQSI